MLAPQDVELSGGRNSYLQGINCYVVVQGSFKSKSTSPGPLRYCQEACYLLAGDG